MEDFRIDKVQILMRQGNYVEAERILKELLAEDAYNVSLMALLAEMKLQQGQLEDAGAIINQAIGQSPDRPYAFFVRARIEIQKSNLDAAESDLGTCISMNPEEADFFAVLAQVKLSRKQFQTALEMADQALALDPENILALNTRSTALLKLNQKEASFETIQGALRHDPNNAYTHANFGWGLLEKRDHKKALEHFKEALKHDPNNEYAKMGMMEAMKSANPIYRWYLQYGFWIGKLTAQYQWGVILGFYFLQKGLRYLATVNKSWAVVIDPLVLILAFIALLTWMMRPLGNCWLRFHKYGKWLLPEYEIKTSNFVAGSLVIFLLGIIIYAITGNANWLSLAVFGFAMIIPLGMMLDPNKKTKWTVAYTVLMAVTGLAAILLSFIKNDIFNLVTVVFLTEFIAYQWISNFFLIKEDNR